MAVVELSVADGYAEKWIDWLLANHLSDLNPADFIVFSFGARPLAMLESGLKKYPDNTDLLYSYAHNLHAQNRDNAAKEYYQRFLNNASNESRNKYKIVEATIFLAHCEVNSLGSPASNPAICGSQRATETLRKIDQYVEALKKLEAKTEDIQTIESDKNSFIEDCNYYGKLNRR